MDKEKLLLKNTVIVTFGKICTQLITFFLLPVYTAYLSTEEFGVVDLLNTLINLLIPVIVFQIEQGIFRFLIDCRDNEDEKKKLISTTIISIIIQSLLYIMIFIVFSRFINNEYKYFLLTNVIVCIFSTIMLQIARGLGDNAKYAIGSFITATITVLLNVLFVVGLRMGANGMLIASFIGNLGCIIYLITSMKLYNYVKYKLFDWQTLKKLWKYSIPIIPNTISWWIVNLSDRSIITYFLGIGFNGIYSAATKFSGVLSTIYSVFNMTWTESASININSDQEERDKFFNKILDSVVRIFGSLCIGIIAFMPFVFNIMINENYNEAYYQIPILIVGAMANILVSFQGAIYIAKKLTKEVAKTSIIAAIINIVVNVTFINKIGLYAASISTAIAYIIMFIYRYFDVKKYVNLKFDKRLNFTMLIIGMLTILLYYIRNYILCTIMAIVVTIFAIVININSVKFVYQTVLKKLIKIKAK